MSLSVNRTETKLDKSEFDIDTKLSLLMKSLTDFYTNSVYIDQIKSIIDQNSVISLRILDWFITNYSKKHRTIINGAVGSIDVYQNYKLQLKSFSKKQFDPFCRKNKIYFCYAENEQGEEKFIETSWDNYVSLDGVLKMIFLIMLKKI
mgnify:CR=1 FL=1